LPHVRQTLGMTGTDNTFPKEKEQKYKQWSTKHWLHRKEKIKTCEPDKKLEVNSCPLEWLVVPALLMEPLGVTENMPLLWI
jgi:hypothetical protein